MSTIYDDVARDARDDYRHDPRPFEVDPQATTLYAPSDPLVRDWMLENYANEQWLNELLAMEGLLQ